MRLDRFRPWVRRKTMAVSARLATCQRALRLERAIRESNGPGVRYIGHLRAFQSNAERDTVFRFGWKNKTAAPVGDERCPARGTTPLRRALTGARPPSRTARAGGRCGGPITGAAWSKPPPPPTGTDPAAAKAPPFGAVLGGLARRRSRSRFAATAVLLPVPAGSLSSSSHRSSVVPATLSPPCCRVKYRPGTAGLAYGRARPPAGGKKRM